MDAKLGSFFWCWNLLNQSLCQSCERPTSGSCLSKMLTVAPLSWHRNISSTSFNPDRPFSTSKSSEELYRHFQTSHVYFYSKTIKKPWKNQRFLMAISLIRVWDPNLAKLLDDGPCLPNDTRDLAALLLNDGATVDGLMAEIRDSPVEVGRKNPWFDKVFIHPRWLFGISSINSINKVKGTFHPSIQICLSWRSVHLYHFPSVSWGTFGEGFNPINFPRITPLSCSNPLACTCSNSI